MCGIVGISVNNKSVEDYQTNINNALKSIKHRGPDNLQQKQVDNHTILGHARLSIIDLSNAAHQPMNDTTERYSLVFNGEIYNYRQLKSELEQLGYSFSTSSDTEVLLNLLIEFGEKGITKLNGFFAFAFFDKEKNEILMARDRFGIKPLLFYQDQNQFIFGSELQSFFAFDIDKSINDEALELLFTLTYIPAEISILKQVKKAKLGHFYIFKAGQLTEKQYYQPTLSNPLDISYQEAQMEVKRLMEDAVKLRMVADVPLGSFLSGGVDSSVVATLAKDLKPDLQTFSVGFEHPFFDESEYANAVVDKIGSQHHQIILGKSHFIANFSEFLDTITEPFADSSAYAVYLLTKETRQHLTVALSGDGADEIFGGYRKHYAEYLVENTTVLQKFGVNSAASIGRLFKSSRSGKLTDFNRKLIKLADSYAMNINERYWKWASFINREDREALLNKKDQTRSSKWIQFSSENLNEFLLNDQQLVLPNDMLTKVDMMSMANALEVRTPFLDHQLVDFVNRLPAHFKVNKKGRKQILIDTFKNQLPEKVYKRNKKGFEIPLEEWLGENIDELLSSELFSSTYLKNQAIFNVDFVRNLRKKWQTNRNNDTIYLIWTLLIFQNWWDKYIK